LLEGVCCLFTFLHSKNTLLPLKPTKFRIVCQGLSWLFTNFLTVKILLCPQIKKISDLLDKGFFSFFLLSLYSINANLTLDEIKKKKDLHVGVFLNFHMGIFYNCQSYGGVLVFSHCLLIFNWEKLLVCVLYVLARGWCLCHSGCASDAT